MRSSFRGEGTARRRSTRGLLLLGWWRWLWWSWLASNVEALDGDAKIGGGGALSSSGGRPVGGLAAAPTTTLGTTDTSRSTSRDPHERQFTEASLSSPPCTSPERIESRGNIHKSKQLLLAPPTLPFWCQRFSWVTNSKV